METNKDKKLKIAMIGQKVVPSRDGGIEVVVEELSTNMVNYGHSVTLFNRKRSGYSSPINYNGCKIVEVKTVDRRSLDAVVYSYFATKKVKKMAKKGMFDVLHFHAEGPCLFLKKLAKKNRKYKIVVTIHGIDWQRGKWKGLGAKVLLHCEKQAVKYADEIIVLSDSQREYFKNNYDRETIVIPNGINLPTMQKPKMILTKFGLNKDDYILNVARIVPEKGIDVLINAWKKVVKETGTNKKLVIVGGEAHCKEYYDEVCALSDGDDSIIMTGFIKGDLLNELFSNAYLYVQPSYLEGMPMSLLEARSFANQCLVSDIPENLCVIGNEDFSFKVGDVEDLKAKLIEIIEKNIVTHKKQHQAHSWEEISQRTLEVYQK